MLKITADLHTHTHFSDGKGSIRDNVQAAKNRKIQVLGISDHGPNSLRFGIANTVQLRAMRKEVDAVNAEQKVVKVLLGLEANVIGLDGSLDVTDEMLELIDLLHVGFHPLITYKSWGDFLHMGLPNLASTATAGTFPYPWSKKIRRKNTQALIHTVQKYPVYMITHPGLHIDVDTVALTKACCETGTFLEINCSHGQNLVPYVETAAEAGGRFVMSSDAHHPSFIGQFDSGIRIARAIGLGPSEIVNIDES